MGRVFLDLPEGPFSYMDIFVRYILISVLFLLLNFVANGFSNTLHELLRWIKIQHLRIVRFILLVLSPFVFPSATRQSYLAIVHQTLLMDLFLCRSKCPDLLQHGKIRILEIGSSPWTSFQLYPEEAHVIAVLQDHDLYNPEEFVQQFDLGPSLHLEQIVLGDGHDLSSVRDGLVDVVITNHALWLTDDMEMTLREIGRVLAKGGVYYFTEHEPDQPGTWRRFFQELFNPVWKHLFLGFDLTFDFEAALLEAGLRDTVVNRMSRLRFSVSGNIGEYLFASHISGSAVKSSSYSILL